MGISVRTARIEDVPGIKSWTRDTFAWGDYVADAIEGWMADESRHLLVAADDADTALAVAMVRMLSPTEGWLSAARVHPDHQRRGLGSLLNDAATGWVAGRGGRVARLATEADNLAAQSQVEKLGYRRTSTWVYARVEGRAADQPVTREKLENAGTSDVDPAWMYWSTGEMYEAGRGLIPSAWSWRRAVVGDLVLAARERRLFQNPAGWAIIEHPEPGSIDVTWVATSPNEFPRLVAGIDGLAAGRGVDEVSYWVPDTGWSREALVRAGADIGETLVFAKAVWPRPPVTPSPTTS